MSEGYYGGLGSSQQPPQSQKEQYQPLPQSPPLSQQRSLERPAKNWRLAKNIALGLCVFLIILMIDALYSADPVQAIYGTAYIVAFSIVSNIAFWLWFIEIYLRMQICEAQ